MIINEHIATEIIQLFSSSEVTNYHIIPYEKDDNDELHCYGIKGIDYVSILNEVKVIYGFSILLELVDKDEFDKNIMQIGTIKSI